MKLNKSLLTAVIVSGSLGMAPSFSFAEDDAWRHDERPQSSANDNTSAPGKTEERGQEMSQSEALELEQALAQKGYDPGAVDGVIDSETRAAIEGFQQDHELAATGIIDPETGELLGIVVFEAS
jgi:hypothetical protein